jgi:HEPN domain-containing protein
VDRKKLQRLAKTRLLDAKALLGRKRWSGAYYLCGYSVECSLKACLLKHLGDSDAIFREPQYLKELSGCWTHDLVKLLKLAGLEKDFGLARGANPALDAFWTVVSEWSESSRYDEKIEQEARSLYEAVSHNPNGVFRWIQSHW